MRTTAEQSQTHAIRAQAETLERLRHSARLHGRFAQRKWLDLVQCTRQEYRAFLEGQKPLSEQALERVASRFDVKPEDLMEGRVDFRGIAVKASAGKARLPDRYGTAAFGRRRTCITSLDFIERKSGWRARAGVLEKLGTEEALFADPMGRISIQFVADMCGELQRRHGYGHAGLFAMGTHSLAGNRNTLLEQSYNQVPKPEVVYERFFGDLLKFYEQNCVYTLTHLDSEKCIVEVRSDPYIAGALGVRHLGNSGVCSLKAGMMAAHVGFIGRSFAKVREIACAHRGDPCCRFEIDYSESRVMPLSSAEN